MIDALTMERYVTVFREKLKDILKNPEFIGKMDVEVNAKQGSITNMNIGVRESVKI